MSHWMTSGASRLRAKQSRTFGARAQKRAASVAANALIGAAAGGGTLTHPVMGRSGGSHPRRRVGATIGAIEGTIASTTQPRPTSHDKQDRYKRQQQFTQKNSTTESSVTMNYQVLNPQITMDVAQQQPRRILSTHHVTGGGGRESQYHFLPSPPAANASSFRAQQQEDHAAHLFLDLGERAGQTSRHRGTSGGGLHLPPRRAGETDRRDQQQRLQLPREVELLQNATTMRANGHSSPSMPPGGPLGSTGLLPTQQGLHRPIAELGEERQRQQDLLIEEQAPLRKGFGRAEPRLSKTQQSQYQGNGNGRQNRGEEGDTEFMSPFHEVVRIQARREGTTIPASAGATAHSAASFEIDATSARWQVVDATLRIFQDQQREEEEASNESRCPGSPSAASSQSEQEQALGDYRKAGRASFSFHNNNETSFGVLSFKKKRPLCPAVEVNFANKKLKAFDHCRAADQILRVDGDPKADGGATRMTGISRLEQGRSVSAPAFVAHPETRPDNKDKKPSQSFSRTTETGDEENEATNQHLQEQHQQQASSLRRRVYDPNGRLPDHRGSDGSLGRVTPPMPVHPGGLPPLRKIRYFNNGVEVDVSGVPIVSPTPKEGRRNGGQPMAPLSVEAQEQRGAGSGGLSPAEAEHRQCQDSPVHSHPASESPSHQPRTRGRPLAGQTTDPTQASPVPNASSSSSSTIVADHSPSLPKFCTLSDLLSYIQARVPEMSSTLSEIERQHHSEMQERGAVAGTAVDSTLRGLYGIVEGGCVTRDVPVVDTSGAVLPKGHPDDRQLRIRTSNCIRAVEAYRRGMIAKDAGGSKEEDDAHLFTAETSRRGPLEQSRQLGTSSPKQTRATPARMSSRRSFQPSAPPATKADRQKELPSPSLPSPAVVPPLNDRDRIKRRAEPSASASNKQVERPLTRTGVPRKGPSPARRQSSRGKSITPPPAANNTNEFEQMQTKQSGIWREFGDRRRANDDVGNRSRVDKSTPLIRISNGSSKDGQMHAFSGGGDAKSKPVKKAKTAGPHAELLGEIFGSSSSSKGKESSPLATLMEVDLSPSDLSKDPSMIAVASVEDLVKDSLKERENTLNAACVLMDFLKQ